MGSPGGYSATLEFDEILAPVDRGSGFVSVTQRQQNAQVNLGILAGAGGFSGGQAVSEQYNVQATDFTLANVNTAQKAFSAPTNGALSVITGAVYSFEGAYTITNTGTTSHTWAILFGGTATYTFGNITVFGNSSATANAAATGGLSGFSLALGTAIVATAASVSATEQVTIEFYGTFKVNAGGTLIPQVQLSAAPGGTQLMKAGSCIFFYPTLQTGALGPWT